MGRFLRLSSIVMVLFALIGTTVAPSTAGATSPSSGPTPLVVGGENATQQYGMVSFWTADRHRCGGTLITRGWVLTAAHCIAFGAVVPGSQVRLGSLNNTVGYTARTAAEVRVHPNFDPNSGRNDVGLVRLDSPMPANFPTTTLSAVAPATNALTRIAGWGLTCQDASVPSCVSPVAQLQQLDMRVLPSSECPLVDPTTGENYFDPATMLCAGAADNSLAGACQGDSGGGMFKQSTTTGRWEQVAITWGDGDDLFPRPNYCSTSPSGGPGRGGFTKIQPFRTWIWTNVFSATPVS